MDWTFERVAGPYNGPANGVVADGDTILFSLMEDMRLMRFDPRSGAVDELRKYTNRVNGLAFGPDGALYGCQDGGRRLVEFRPDGSLAAVDALLDGKYHNHPCDLAVDKTGRIWFSDPHSPILPFGPQIFPPLDHASVLRLSRNDRKAWVATRVTYDTVAPRAVLLSADEQTLYVADGDTRGGTVRELRAYPVRADGTVGPFTVLATFGTDHRGPHRGIEGLCLDRGGNILACGGWQTSGPGPAISLFSPAGRLIGAHPFPDDLPNRCCLGGAHRDTLYVTTAGGCLYAAKVS